MSRLSDIYQYEQLEPESSPKISALAGSIGCTAIQAATAYAMQYNQPLPVEGREAEEDAMIAEYFRELDAIIITPINLNK